MKLASALVALFVFGLSPAFAQNPMTLLGTAHAAQSERSFEGVVVFMHDGRFDALRIVHRPGLSGYEQVSSLNGAPRALFSDAKGTRIESPSGARQWPRPALAGAVFDAGRVQRSYRVVQSSKERIAGFDTQVVDAAARDDVRFSQRLWINPDNGMLLGVALVGPKQETLQQMMFTSLVLDARASPQVPVARESEPQWALPATLPSGFDLIGGRVEGNRRSFVFSDGLASITLYVEPRENSLDRLTTLRRGATHLAARQIGQHRAVVVGEVPLATAVDFANRVATAMAD